MTVDPSTITLEVLEHDPDPVLAALRAEAPVCFVPALDMWLVTRWDDVAFVDAHPDLFSAATEPSFLARALGRNMLTMDPPESTRVRNAMLPPFQPGGESGAFVADRLVALCDDLIDDFGVRGRADLMAHYAAPVAASSLAAVLGIDEGWETVWEWCRGVCTDIANFTSDPERTAVGDQAREAIGAALDARLDALADEPDGTALWAFAHADAGRRPLTREEIVNNVRLMISGGINEPRDGIGLVTWVLLEDPALRATVAGDAGRWRRLVEEVLRRHSPVGTITRQATRDVELGGVVIAAGQLVAGVLRSANLDETRWTDPSVIDLERREGGHAAFALGDHRCLGEWLGRQEVRIGAQRLFERLPGLRLAADAAVELTGFEFRGPASLLVEWDT